MSEFGRRRSTFFAPFRQRGRPRSTVFAPRRFRRARQRRALPRRRRRNIRTGGFLGQELKFYDTSLIAGGIATNTDATGGEDDPSAVILLNTVVQGDGESQRDGRKINMKSIFVTGVVNAIAQSDQTVAEEATDIAIWLVLDKQTNGATIASENVFKNTGANILTGTSVMRNLQFSSRYRILDKVRFQLPNPQMSGDSTNFEQHGVQVPFKLSANLRNMQVIYTGTTENVANITDNSLHIISFASNNGMAPTISYNARLRFIG